MGICDANCKFIYFNVGATGRCSDGGIFNASSFAQALKSNHLKMPPPRPLPGRQLPLGYVVVADDAFTLNEYVMKPYSHADLSANERIFNHRLSRARRTIENAFGPMANFSHNNFAGTGYGAEYRMLLLLAAQYAHR